MFNHMCLQETGIAGFEKAYEQIERSCKNFVDSQAYKFAVTNNKS